MRPAPPADRRTLIRRAYYDLVGLPPTWGEVQAFANDPTPTPEAFEAVVDRLLASPAYGERWGRHWLDVARFADTKDGVLMYVDDICFIRSMHANTPNHEQSMRLMNCGDVRLSRPSMGAWVTYGLGTDNQNLPGFIAMCPGLPVADVSNWRAAFLPGIYQGTHLDTQG